MTSARTHHVLLWTRDSGAREAIPIVLARIDQGFTRCESVADVVAEMAVDHRDTLLILGPSFTPDEARAIRRSSRDETGHDLVVVLLEDATAPLPPRLVLTSHDDPVRLRLPVRPRDLVGVVVAWRKAA